MGSERRSEPLRRSTGRLARTAPRRGAHLYGVLDYEALTVVTDRRPGPSEPLDDAYPLTLAGCVELACRHGLEALWVHESALARLGVPTDADEAPAGVNGWEVHCRGDADQVELAVPAWLAGSTTWAEAESGRELAGALAVYEAAQAIREPLGVCGEVVGYLTGQHVDVELHRPLGHQDHLWNDPHVAAGDAILNLGQPESDDDVLHAPDEPLLALLAQAFELPGVAPLDHNWSKQSILVWVWICVGALRVVEGRL